MNEIERKDLRIEIKALDESGTFEGLASTYGNIDLGGDIIEPGAFTKTLSDRGPKRVILWQHKDDEPIGEGELIDTETGLKIRGQLELGLETAKKAYMLLKKGLVSGLSIGYSAVKDKVEINLETGVRRLKEVKLWEVSVVTFPMNELAQVSGVKSDGQRFNERIERITSALTNLSPELKIGATHSKETLSRLESMRSAAKDISAHLDALLGATAAADSTADGEGAAKSTTSVEPDAIHSLLSEFTKRGFLRWN